MYIDKINNPSDLKKLDIKELPILADEIRELIISKVSERGGHLASNLGIVELTMALHYVFDSPIDKIVYDVSHQTYSHKILTGRKEAFACKEKYSTVTGFSNPDESEHDLFVLGHTSTSVSLACGFAKARDVKGSKENVIAVIGDASLDGGQAFEAINYASELKSNIIVVINDNEMSIAENYGALAKHLSDLRVSKGNVDNNFFEALGFEYYLVENGNSVEDIIDVFKKIKDADRPIVVHVCTKKGYGYKYAEEDKEKWHWARPFDREKGEFLTSVPKENYGSIVSDYLLDKMKKDSKVVTIAASTPVCIGFDKEKRELAGAQYIDVGIAEQNGVTMAAAMAKAGCKPVFATNATFIQRAYDQIVQEISINKAPATLIVTHGSVFGHHNDTHIGLLDIPLLGNIPNLMYLAPTNKEEYIDMLDWSIEQKELPVAIRVPWTGVTHADEAIDTDYSNIKYKIVSKGSKVCIIALGGFFELGKRTADMIKKEIGVDVTLINPRYITGVDKETLDWIKDNHEVVATLEDGILSGGFGAKISQYYADKNIKVCNFGFSMEIPRVYNPNELMKKNLLTEEQIMKEILKNC